MKYTGNYFPFIIISLLLYGLLFYLHDNSPVEVTLPLNTGKQAIQVHLTPSAPNLPAMTPSLPETSTSAIASHTEKVAPPTLETAPVQEEAKPNSQQQAKVKIAKKQHQMSIKEHKASADALLKALIFNEELIDIDTAATTAKPKNKKKTERIQTDTSIASMLPITEPVPQHVKKTGNITPKQPASIEQEKEMSPKITPKVNTQATPAKRDATNVTNAEEADATSTAATQGVLQDAIVVSGQKPTYPRRAILRNQQGRVVVKMTVMSNGEAKDAEIVTSSGFSVLDKEVLAFINAERFIPALRGVVKVTSEQQFSFRFQLQ